MKSKTNLPNNVTCPLAAKPAADVTGVLCGLDRLRQRGTLRALYQPTVRLRYLFVWQVLLKGFKNHAIGVTRRIIEHGKGMAINAGRPWGYLDSGKISQEEVVRRIMEQDPVEQVEMGPGWKPSIEASLPCTACATEMCGPGSIRPGPPLQSKGAALPASVVYWLCGAPRASCARSPGTHCYQVTAKGRVIVMRLARASPGVKIAARQCPCYFE